MRQVRLWAFVVLGAVLAAGVAQAVSFTLELTAGQVATIQWKYAERGGASTGFATVQLWMAAQIDRMIKEWEGQKGQADQRTFCQSFLAASTANRNSSCTAIGQPTGCNPCQ